MPTNNLLALPDDLMLVVARHALAIELPAALRLLQTCTVLHARLDVVIRAEVKALRLCWLEVVLHSIGDDGLTLHVLGSHGDKLPYAAGPLLPTVGRSTWAVRVETSLSNVGLLHLGVCDAACRSTWSLELNEGRLHREDTVARKHVPPPDGFPDGHWKQVLFDSEGKPERLYKRANGAIIEICLDHDAGTLSLGVNGGPMQRALAGFPVGAAMRPYAWLPFYRDAVRYVRPYIQHSYVERAHQRQRV